MASTKAALKGVKVSLDSNNFEKAASLAQDIIKQDNKNQTAFLFLGFANEKLGRLDAAESAIRSALDLKPQDPIQAYKGLITLYEKQGNKRLDAYHDVVYQLASLYAEQDDRIQCQNVIDKYELFAKKHGARAQYRRALELILPTCSLYSTLEGRVMQPSLAYQRILESAQAEEKEWINTQIGERRTRLGAKIDQVTQQVKSEAISKFQVEEKLAALIEWTRDDDIRHDLEEKMFQRVFDNLLVMPSDSKPVQRDKVLNIANGMVIIKQQFPLAWKVALEWVDAENLQEWDVNILRDYIGYFPDDGLSKVLRGFLDSDSSPFPPAAKYEDQNEEDEVKLSEADQLILMNEGLEDCPDSLLGHRLMAYAYLQLNEHQSTVDMARKAQKLHLDAQKTYALDLTNSIDGVDLMLGNALITYQSPRHHPEAKHLFQNILDRKPKLTAALLGVGLIFEEDEDYNEAVKFLQQAADRDALNLRIRLELAWCRALDHDLEAGLTELEDVLVELDREKKSPDLVMKSEVLYRIAYCKWHIDTSTKARKDKNGPYRYLIDSIKANVSYAPAYTLLGIYFQDYGKSKPRARVALQKAFELSTSELEAAHRLAKAFADGAEWDLVELVAQRVVTSGKARPAPGSKKKAFSWPYAALGVVQMNKQQYSQSIVAFQSALRISPDDYHSWVGLGESYHNSGRYIAASRAFARAESINHDLPLDQTWFAKYMLANVQREMGAYDEAVLAYEAVLQIKPDEFGVLIALLQTQAESAWAKVALGMFGEAAQLAVRAVKTASKIAYERADVFNLWKAVGDACSVLGHARAFASEINLGDLVSLLHTQSPEVEIAILQDLDKVTIEGFNTGEVESASDTSDKCLLAAVLAHKRAVYASAHDTHAQAVSWYNLGWAEYQVYVLSGASLQPRGKRPQRFFKAAMKCFKRAIELESGNSEFWNALGVVTMTTSPKVAQHSFVRSLHLNDHSARAWTNLGVLYLTHNENQLANEAFTKAQSADPEYADAWLGQGLLATLYDNKQEARGLFTHAFQIADSSSSSAKQHYAVSAFDHLLKTSSQSSEITLLLQTLFALRQLYTKQPANVVGAHLMALFAERVGDFDGSAEVLEEVCTIAETEYEKSESNEFLARFAQAKADLARAQLAQGKFEEALENAETALDLSSEDDLGPVYAEARQKWRLSANITAGLAHSHLEATDESVKLFQIALEESQNAPEAVCMLAQVLWAKGGPEEKEAAMSQLINCTQNNPENVQAAALLAVFALLEDDSTVSRKAEERLKQLRSNDKVGVPDKIKINKVLAGSFALKETDAGEKQNRAAMADAVSSIMLSPAQPQGWLELAHVTGNEYASEMAVQNAERQIPPGGSLQVEDLAEAYANTGRRDDALQARMLAPWMSDRFEMTADAL